MGLKVPRLLVEFLLLGPEDDRRHLQDSPILGDVWVEFARYPGQRRELLITPHREQAAAETASALHAAVPAGGPLPKDRPNIAYLQGVVAACLTFEELIRYVLPMTYWWSENRIAQALTDYLTNADTLAAELEKTRIEAEHWLAEQPEVAVQDFETRRRFSVLTALLLWAANQNDIPEKDRRTQKEQAADVVAAIAGKEREIVETLTRIFDGRLPPRLEKPYVWTVSLNRRATPALSRSVPAVKADAARTLFTVNCNQIVWAVIDSGVARRRSAPAHRRRTPASRHRSGGRAAVLIRPIAALPAAACRSRP